jgi:hypothetical protein
MRFGITFLLAPIINPGAFPIISIQPIFLRRTSGHCLGTLILKNVLPSVKCAHQFSAQIKAS